MSRSSELIPAEGLPAGLAPVPAPVGLAALVLARTPGADSAGAAVGEGARTASGASRTARTIAEPAAEPAATAAAGAVTLVAAVAAWYGVTGSPSRPRPAVADSRMVVSPTPARCGRRRVFLRSSGQPRSCSVRPSWLMMAPVSRYARPSLILLSLTS
ncbi:hypothetical protein GCM10010269_30590 [Streptomyces humidus]|uniref:Uncharacterized protein n=1 Tax=Streptomyces humidus TaxID=52259 RepID=A0A918L3H5_9ACTN|nr:hypothetical protein GCM10010269_30590 [Streptomyces humidus]